jgi:hypothetical protein
MAVPPKVRQQFERALAERGLSVEAISNEGVYVVKTESGNSTVSLENIAREFADHDDEERLQSRLANLVESILGSGQLIPTSWEEAQPHIRWAVENIDIDMGDSMLEQISDQVRVGPVYVSPDDSQVAFLPPSFLDTWGQTRASLLQTAGENMDTLLHQVSIHVEEIDGHRLGMFALPDDFPAHAFKAALLVCPALRDVVEPALGWPVFAVMPNRDFVYLIPHEDRELLPRLGPTVVREFNESGYPISTEVFEIADQGIRAIAEFQARQGQEADQDDEGMKTIEYRGGVVTFRVPAHWEEEYEDEGGGTFYDEEGAGRLDLNVITFKSARPVDEDTPVDMLELRAEKVGGEVVSLPNGNACLHYRQDGEDEDGDEFVVWYWEVASTVPPDHARIARFAFSVNGDMAEDPQVEQTLEMLRDEIPATEFAEELGK